MRPVNIEITSTKGLISSKYASWKQISYIHSLMLQKGMGEDFVKHFSKNGKIICTTISRTSASLLIKALLNDKEIKFTRFVSCKKNPSELPIIHTYRPSILKKDVRKITFEEQRALEQKYLSEYEDK